MSTCEEMFLAHQDRPPYDPVKAHEYYMRTRKLKGRDRNKPVPEEVKKEYEKHLATFLKSLPMAKKTSEGGADLKKTAEFVNKMRKMSDKQMVEEAQKLVKRPPGGVVSQENMGKMKTINALLKNRSRVRAASGTGPKDRLTPRVWEDGSTDKRPIVPKSKTSKTSKSKSAPPAKQPPKPSPFIHQPPKPRPFLKDDTKQTTTEKLLELARLQSAQTG